MGEHSGENMAGAVGGESHDRRVREVPPSFHSNHSLTNPNRLVGNRLHDGQCFK